MPNFVNVDNKKMQKIVYEKWVRAFEIYILFDHGYFCPQSDKLLIKWMYVDEIPKQYMVSKFWASITNMSYKRILIYQKEQQLITYLSFRFFN